MSDEADPTVVDGQDPVDDPPAEATTDGARRPRRRFSEKRFKLLLLVGGVSVVVIILLWGMVPERIYEIEEVLEDSDGFDGKMVSIKGVVNEWETGRTNFTLVDSNDPTLIIQVSHSGPIPEGFGINVTAVVKGVFHRSEGLFNIDSEQIQIGCPSKY